MRRLATALAGAALIAGAGVAHARTTPVRVVPSLEPAKTAKLWRQVVHGRHTHGRDATLDCRPLRAVFYAATDWLRLATKLAATPSPCAAYYVSVPPLVGDKTQPRSDQAWRIRALGSSFHAAAEINVTGWTTWVANNGGNWYAAGVEARRRMAAAGFDVARGDAWVVNELSSAVRQGVGSARANMRELLRGLYDGGGFVPAVRGGVFVSGMSQATTDVSTYQARLQDWLEDTPFWADMSAYVADWSQELYGDFRNYGVAGTAAAQRRDSLNDYLQHELLLANAAPDSGAAGRAFLQSAYSPLANAAWQWETGFGWTSVAVDQMKDYVSAQTYALRHASAAAAQDHAGFAWSPKNLAGLSSTDFNTQTAALLDRLAAAIRDSAQTVDPADPGVGACGPAGQNLWCAASIDGAWFNEAWKALASWRPSLLVFATPAQALTAGTPSAAMTVQLQTSTGVPLTATQPLQLTLATSSPKGRFAPSATGPWTSTLTLAIGTGSTVTPSFYYRDALAGSALLTASATGKQSGSQTETVAPGPIASLRVAPTSATLAVGMRRLFTASGIDVYGNAVSVAGTTWTTGAGTPGSISPASGVSTVFTAGPATGSGTVVAALATASGTLTATAAVSVLPVVRVSSVVYAVQWADLVLTLSVVDAFGSPIAGAATSFSVSRNGTPYSAGSVTSGSDGRAASTLVAAPAGCYSTSITGVTASGYVWDKTTPANQFCR